MPRFRTGQYNKRPIDSIKHIVDLQGGTILNVKQVVTLAFAVENPELANTDNVQPGCRINAVYLNVQVVATTEAALPNIYMIIYKIPGGNIVAGAIPNANVTGSNNFKRQIFHTEMKMMANSSNTQIPITVFNGVLKIPKVFHTFRIDDFIQIQLFAPGVNFNWCVQCIYKEYR